MKKILLIIIAIVFFIFFKSEKYSITKDAIRFRVIANSNSLKDIIMKEKVVKEVSNILFMDFSTQEEAEKNIYNNLHNVETKIDNLFKDYNYDKDFNISYGYNIIPRKEYHGKIYEEGMYNSLVIEIGSGKGNNYFCILYPSLCLIDYNKKENSKYKFKIIEIINKIF